MLESLNPIALLFLLIGIVVIVWGALKLIKQSLAMLFWAAVLVVGVWAGNYGWENLGLPAQSLVSQAGLEALKDFTPSGFFQELKVKEHFQEWCAKL